MHEACLNPIDLARLNSLQFRAAEANGRPSVSATHGWNARNEKVTNLTPFRLGLKMKW